MNTNTVVEANRRRCDILAGELRQLQESNWHLRLCVN